MKKIIAIFLAMVLVMSNAPQVYAWKGGTHIYIADILIEEVKTGKIKLEGVGEFSIPEEFKNAIVQYPEAFRAGSIGPDFYPDIYYGQSFIHPESEGSAGEWLKIMFEEYQKLSPSDPEREKALAFLLGVMVHYSGDIFGHDFVNKWARGSFPNVSDGITDEETKIIMRHMIIESYIDGVIPHEHKTNVKIEAPKNYLKDTFLYNKNISKPPYIATAVDMRNKLYDAAFEYKAFNGDGNILDYLSYPFTTNYANYMEYWSNDIDRALDEWMNTSEEVALAFVDDNISKQEAINAVDKWQTDYLNYVTPVPDVVIDTFNLPGQAVNEIFKVLGLDVLEEQWKALKMLVFKTAVESATGMDLAELIELEEKYEEKLSDQYLFEENAKEHLQQYLKNFGQTDDAMNQEFNAFNNSIVLAKLCLLGADNLNNLIYSLTGQNGPFSKQDLIETYNYFDVTVHTKSNGFGDFHGTDDDIFFGIRLKDGTLYERVMDKKYYNDFEGGDKDTYKIELPQRISLSDIEYVHLRKRSITGDDWTPNFMKISYKGTDITSWNINNEFTGNETQTFTLNGVGERVYGTTQLDTRIIDSTKSLDESDQIEFFMFYSNPMYKEKIYDKLFMPEEQFN